MSPNTNQSIDEETPVSNTVRLALIDQKLDLVIKDHDKRLTALELWKETKGRNAAAVVAPYIAGIGLIIGIAAMVNWK